MKHTLFDLRIPSIGSKPNEIEPRGRAGDVEEGSEG